MKGFINVIWPVFWFSRQALLLFVKTKTNNRITHLELKLQRGQDKHNLYSYFRSSMIPFIFYPGVYENKNN